MDKLRAMQTFVAIADHGSLTKAASALATSTPTVARTLSMLEAALGVRLLTRTTRRLALTDEGRVYLERARIAVAAVADADAAVSDDTEEIAGRVTLTAPVLYGQLAVAPIVLRFLAAHPKVSVNLQLFDRVVNLIDEGIDIGVRIGALDDSTLINTVVGRVRRVVVASPDYLERHGRPLRPRDLVDHNCLGFTAAAGPRATGPVGPPRPGLGPVSSCVWWSFDEPSAKGGTKSVQIPVRGNIDFNHVGPAIDACVAGVGIGMFVSYQVAPLFMAPGPPRLEVLLEGFEPPPRPVSLVFAGRRHTPRRTRALIDALKTGLMALKSPFAPPDTATTKPATTGIATTRSASAKTATTQAPSAPLGQRKRKRERSARQ